MAHVHPPRRIVQTLPEPATPGTVTVDVIEVLVEGSPQLSAHLSGSGDGWSASSAGLQLQPETAPAQYRLKFELSSSSLSSSFSLVGTQVFFQTEDVNTQKATIFTPASESGDVTLGFLHDITGGHSVTYQIFFGVLKAGHIFWPDPTIAFEPQSEPPATGSKR